MAKFLEVEYSEMTEFAKRCEELLDMSEQIREVLIEVGNQYLAELIERTPVNKDLKAPTRGNLKAQWKIDNPSVALKVTDTGNGYMLELINTTYYASWVEKGHRKVVFGHDTGGWVMGQFFVRKTETIWQNGKLDAVLTKRINQWLQSIFD